MGSRSRLGAGGVLPGSRRKPAPDVDKTSVHAHSAPDIAGLGVLLFPPPVTVVGVTDAPVISSVTMTDLDEMQVTVTPPATFPVWECRLWFDATFYGLDTVCAIRLVQDPADTAVVLNRQEMAVIGNQRFTMALFATVVLAAEVPVDFTVQWASLSGVDLTADAAARQLRYSLRPYQA